MATFFSELVCKHADIIPLPLKGKIYGFMKDYVDTVNPGTLRKHRDQLGVYHFKLLSIVAIPYSPLDPTHPHYTPTHNHALRQLKQLCVEFGVLRLHIELIGKHELSCVIENGLLDFVVCLPWIVEAGSRAHSRACELLSFLRSEMVLQPPSLINLARAKLAVMHFGLSRIVNLSVQEVFMDYHKEPEYSDSEIL